jgi:rSAM/selenodomain-associated transferase 2
MISVVIPTINAAPGLPRCFNCLLEAAMRGIVREVIVSDGGSTDDTRSIADVAGARLIEADKGRGQQLAKGAEAARGDWLLFLHADTALEQGWENEALSFMERATLEHPRAAAFRFGLDDFDPNARRLEAMVALRCWLFALPYGDQGLLIPTRLYLKLGGFKPIPLMEDVDLIRRLGRRRLIMLRSRVVTSAERYRTEGYFRRSLRNLGILLLYKLRVPTSLLARLYG